MEVFHCEVPADGPELPYYSGPCESKPPALEPCKRVLSAWAMGAPSYLQICSFNSQAAPPCDGDRLRSAPPRRENGFVRPPAGWTVQVPTDQSGQSW
ncbi:DBH [Cordylochernes scorpioides]|uniref:DBH n=1 Tax=Cordylochernes scorpioides TaxID=51811 RepID=A0ABY6KBE6_9ARAC|nr:DBH [Cordylochernes scorpioides]